MPSGRWLLAAVPLALVVGHVWPERHTLVFFTSVVAILPLAAAIGRATEALAGRLGGGIGGLLNATFGNAAELIISMFALFAGLDAVVKASLTGSIIGNILLVLGASLLAGGLKHTSRSSTGRRPGWGRRSWCWPPSGCSYRPSSTGWSARKSPAWSMS